MSNAHEASSWRNVLKLIAKKIKLARVERGWSQETLAVLAGLHPNYIGRVERAETNIGVVNLVKIAGALGVSAHELLKPDHHTGKLYPSVEELRTVYYVGHA